ncbi:34823_t:CDS:2, partial [Racocetra persica]
ISGIVRPKVSRNQQQQEVEIELEKYQIINETKLLPFEIKDEININEDTRFRYRYLDLRRNISKKPLIPKIPLRVLIASWSPAALGKQRYYTLPQSPQMFKQLLMMSGFDKHYQIDKSFRNEDARSNRQIEFSQLDLEMSFTSTKKIMKLTEKFLKNVLKKSFNCQLKTPFTILTYQQAIEKYGTDKPDLLCNGEEVLSGGLRIYQRELQAKVFTILGYSPQKQEKYFGYFLQALEFAAPPHGGFGLGIDRLLAIILNLKSLKEVIAFPKNIDGSCSLTGTPNYFEK